jgi:hypothetical protein
MGRAGHKLDVIHQSALRASQARFIELAFQNCFHAFVGCSLNTQEVGVAVQSIRALIQEGDVACDHLLVPADEMAFGEVNDVRKLDDLP